MSSADAIEKQVTLHAKVSQVWNVIANAKEFGNWFGVHLEGDFAVGQSMTGRFGGEMNETAIIEIQKKLGLPASKIRAPKKQFIFCTVDYIEPEKCLRFRWIPYGIDAEIDPKSAPSTLVEFRLENNGSGTLLTISESGFNQLSEPRRERAFRMNNHGWDSQIENIKRYIERN